VPTSPFPRRTLRKVACTGAVLLLAALPLAAQRSGGARPVPRQVTPRGPLPPAEQAIIDLFEKARASVVYITTQRQLYNTLTRAARTVPSGTGSGFVWDSNGHIVTNNHVVAGAAGARIRLSDGRDAAATLVGRSEAHDLAVLRIDMVKLPAPLPLGSSHDLKVGQTTYAIGNPFGLDWTLTTGIISALDRALPDESGGEVAHLIQTDAAINPGNSGGPLLDSAGRLIGVNTAIISPAGVSSGVGFAVPADTVNRVVPQLIANGRYARPALGIGVDERLNRYVAQRFGVTGVVVRDVSRGTAAATAGLRGIRQADDGEVAIGDVIVAVEGQPVDSVARLRTRLDDHAIGAVVRLTVVRDGRRRDVTVMLEAAPQ
jgi:S1-C subfamily serine protease